MEKNDNGGYLEPGNNHENKIPENQSGFNLFQGRTESENQDAKFPAWDIVPPGQFINPRIKK